MPDIYRPSVKVGNCITLLEMSVKVGGKPDLFRKHKQRQSLGFPRPVARFGNAELYVEAELDAFYKSMVWRSADASLAKLTGE